MSVDNDLLLVNAQDVTGTEDGNNTVDIGADARIGAGEKITAQFKLSTLALATDQLGIQIEGSVNSDMSSATVVVEREIGVIGSDPALVSLTFTAHKRFRYYRAKFTMAGTGSPKVTVSAWLHWNDLDTTYMAHSDT